MPFDRKLYMLKCSDYCVLSCVLFKNNSRIELLDNSYFCIAFVVAATVFFLCDGIFVANCIVNIIFTEMELFFDFRIIIVITFCDCYGYS